MPFALPVFVLVALAGCGSETTSAMPSESGAATDAAPPARADGGDVTSATTPDASLEASQPVTTDGGEADDAGDAQGGETPAPADPGRGQWDPVPRDEVAEVCRLDPDILDEIDRTLNLPWGVVRYGRLCHEFYPQGPSQATTPQENWSATKTLGGVVMGIAAYQTRGLSRSGRKTGPLSDMDRVDHWLDEFTFNQEAQIAHMLGMVAHNESLEWGDKAFAYDGFGDRVINRLSDILTTAIAQDPDRFGNDLEEFTQRFLFEPVGMRHSTWSDGASDKVFGYSWKSPVRDMMRLGLLLLNDGVWSGERILGEDWVYKMTHPSFEDAALDYGYLTWLEARSDAHECNPSAVHAEYPHGLSGATDCNGPTTSYGCDQEHDIGVWHANGLFGQLIIGMKGLDMVVAIKDFGLHPKVGTPAVPASWLWPVLRPAVVALDPTYSGDEEAFCEAYGSGRYAPDLK